jgi:hypothetical protein
MAISDDIAHTGEIETAYKILVELPASEGPPPGCYDNIKMDFKGMGDAVRSPL